MKAAGESNSNNDNLGTKKCILKYYRKKVIRQEMYKIQFSEWYTGLNDTNNLFMAIK